MTLLDNQKQALIKLKKYKVGALFMKPGSGKTRVACELINDVNPDYVLWITPFQTKENLEIEISNGVIHSLKKLSALSLSPTQIDYTCIAETNSKIPPIVTLLWMKA